jgi:Mg2+ and Co2+ transporter CorA
LKGRGLVSNDLVVGILGTGGVVGLAQAAIAAINARRKIRRSKVKSQQEDNQTELSTLRQEQLDLRQALRERADAMEKQEEECRKELLDCYNSKTEVLIENVGLRAKIAQLLSEIKRDVKD